LESNGKKEFRGLKINVTLPRGRGSALVFTSLQALGLRKEPIIEHQQGEK
jgi:hypothetical protein